MKVKLSKEQLESIVGAVLSASYVAMMDICPTCQIKEEAFSEKVLAIMKERKEKKNG